MFDPEHAAGARKTALNFICDQQNTMLIAQRTQHTQQFWRGGVEATFALNGLQRGKHKWTFNWQGIKISAAITDPDFFDQLAARSIALHQGDALDADLAINQRFLPAAQVWENVSYVIAKVYSVKVGETQTTMDFTTFTGRPTDRPSDRKH